ncbi:MAG: SGNH/GDSL hydrolase family protein [Elusimicrobiota bacterium]
MSRTRSLVLLSFGAAFFAAVLLALYLLGELLFPLLLPRFNHRLRWRLDYPQTILAQSTKRALAPRDYIAIAGDSYAVGLGDEWETVDKSGRRPFASMAILHEGTGRDVLTFGYGGAGSLTGFVAAPIAMFGQLGRTLFYRLPEPSVVLAYVYEGNDFEDNLRESKNYQDAAYFDPPPGGEDEAALALRAAVAARHPLILEHRCGVLGANLFFGRFLLSSARKALEILSSRPQPPLPPTHSRGVPTHNDVLVGGRLVRIPGRLQGPAPELSHKETVRGLLVLQGALRALRAGFPKARILVVYIPSVLSCYRLAPGDADVENLRTDRDRFPSRGFPARSDELVSGVRSVCRRLGLDFVDTRPTVRAAAERMLVHGPADWRHFNRYGYLAMTRPILDRLRDASASSSSGEK